MIQKEMIVHIIFRDKFTSGYINFMEMVMPEYQHVYMLSSAGFKLKLVEDANIIYIRQLSDWYKNKALKRSLIQADKIIISGVFGTETGLTLFYPQLLKKTYLHFWGNDFYRLRDPEEGLKKKIIERIKKYCIRHCRAWINLIPGDYDELVKIICKEKKHFVAPMPGDPRKKADFDRIIAETVPHEGCRIIVGNSATETNRHFEVFEMLAHLKDEDIEIICPLSYGDKEYGQKVIEKGKEIFGDKFRALTDYMNIDDYRKLLATCDVGVFNNDRQQGMGNIRMLLAMGKKVFMRTNTSMWESFIDRGYKAFDINILNGMDINDLSGINDDLSSENIRVGRKRNENRINYNKKQWLEVLND